MHYSKRLTRYWFSVAAADKSALTVALMLVVIMLCTVVSEAHAGRSGIGKACSDYSRAKNQFFGSAQHRFAIDMHHYCYRHYSRHDRCVVPTPRKRNDAYTWRCKFKSGSANYYKSMNLDQACKKQYGPFAQAKLINRRNPKSWYCELPSAQKLPHNRAAYGLDLGWYCRHINKNNAFRAEHTTINGQTDWFCVNPAGGPNSTRKISLGAACVVQYGHGAHLYQRRSGDPNSYFCSLLKLGTKTSGGGSSSKQASKPVKVRGGFDIPRHSFNFANDWKSDFVVKLPGFGKVNLGRTRYGLCGGMIYAAHDSYWYESTSGRKTDSPDRPGGITDVPPKGNRLRKYIWDRQMDSLKRNKWQSVRKLSAWLAKPVRKVEKLSMQEFNKKIRPGLDKGWAIPLMVVISPRFTKNHQVLAVGYEWDTANNEWDIILYDPNMPDQETILHTKTKKIRPRRRGTGYQLAFRGFFVTSYRGKKPWWGPGVSRGPWRPNVPTTRSPRDPWGTGGKGPDKPKTLPSDPR